MWQDVQRCGDLFQDEWNMSQDVARCKEQNVAKLLVMGYNKFTLLDLHFWWVWKSWKVEIDTLFTLLMGKEAKRKREGLNAPLSEKSLFIWVFSLPEVALEETGEGLAVPGFVAGHLIVPLRFTIKGVILQHNSGSFLFSKHIVISFLSLRNYFLTTFYQLLYNYGTAL